MKKKTQTYTLTGKELDEVVSEMRSDLAERVRKMTPTQRKKDAAESKKYTITKRKLKDGMEIVVTKNG